MPSQVAALLYTCVILWLFYDDSRQKRTTSWALWIPLVYFFLIASRPVSMWLGLQSVGTAEQVLDGSPVDRLTYATLQALAALILLQRTSAVQKVIRTQPLLLLFLTYCFISISWSDYPFVALKRYSKFVTDVLMILIVLTEPVPRDGIIRFLKRPVFVMIPLSVLFIKYYPNLGRTYSFWSGQVYFCGVSYDKNLLGNICLFWGLGFVWLLAESLKRESRRASTVLPVAGILFVTWWTLAISSSATSMGCFLIGSFFILWTRLPAVRKWPVLVHTPVLAVTTVATLAITGQLGAWVFRSLQRDETLTGRTELWQRVLELTTNPVLGTGFESFWLGERLEYLWSLYWWRPNQAHNGYLELYANLGLVGLALFLVFLFSSYLRITRDLKQADSYASLRLSWVVVSVIYNFTEASFRMQNLAWIFLLFAVFGMPRFRTVAQRAKVWSPAQLRHAPPAASATAYRLGSQLCRRIKIWPCPTTGRLTSHAM